MTKEITNNEEMIDSRDVIARIEELESLAEDCKEDGEEMDEDEAKELKDLKAFAEEAESSPDWIYGETLIREDYFTQYIEDLISDCYEMPKEINSGEWPWRHVTIDYEAAAEEAKVDYTEADLDGETYLIRNC